MNRLWSVLPRVVFPDGYQLFTNNNVEEGQVVVQFKVWDQQEQWKDAWWNQVRNPHVIPVLFATFEWKGGRWYVYTSKALEG